MYISRALLFAAALLLAAPLTSAATLQPKTLQAWDKYVKLTEQRIARELQSDIKGKPSTTVQITRMHTRDEGGKQVEADDGMIHHWKGSTFIPSVTLDQVMKFVQDYDNHSRYFQEVVKSRLDSRQDDTFKIYYRLKRTKVITAVYNTNHTVTYTRHSPTRMSARSATTRIAEVENPDQPNEREKPIGDDSGFFWRLNSYWRYEERDGGVIVECESISLSRDIPFGFAWLVKGFVESVPRESLNNTLSSLRTGVTKA